MSLPFFKKSQSPSPAREYFFALEIDQHLVKSAVWSVINSKSQVLAVGHSTTWDGRSEDSLITASDDSLSDSVARLDPSGSTQPQKVIFGLQSDWLTEDKVAPDKLQLLKSLSHKLSLSAVGFVVTPEAGVRFLQYSEGVPPTVILIGVWKDHLELTLSRLGKVDGTQVIKRSELVVDDVIEGLSRFPNVDMLPSRVLLYDSGFDLEEIRQQLLSHPWQSPQTRLHFLHFPKIELLPHDFSIRAISLAGGTEVARAIGLLVDQPISPVPPPVVPENSEQSEADSLGFTPITPPPLPFSQESVTEAEVVTPSFAPTPAPRAIPPSRKLPRFTFPSLSLPKFKLNFTFLPLVFVTGFLVLGVLLFMGYWYLPKAQVKLTLSPKYLSHQFELMAQTSSSSSPATAPVLPAEYIKASVSEQKSAPATGTKVIGDKATGKISVINGTSAARTFPAGTVVTSPSGLRFTFDSEVAVASAAGSADPNSYQPGKAEVNVTAAVIGTDSNLSAGTQFKIGSFATLDYVAKNDTAFSGGSSREVKAVAKNDLVSLRSELTSLLKDQAKSQLMDQTSQEKVIVSESISLQVSSETSSHKEGDIADEVTMQQTVDATAVSFVKSDFDNLVSDQVKPLIPAGYEQMSQKDPVFTVKKVDKDIVTLEVKVTAELLPTLPNGEIIAQIRGKSPDKAKEYLSTITGVNKVTYIFTPPLPKSLMTLPHIAKNIDLRVSTE